MWLSSTDLIYWPSPRGGRNNTSTGGARRAPRGDARRLGGRRASARTRRRLVRSLRNLASRRPPREAMRRRLEALLHDRVAPIRGELVEIAALLEQASHPDLECVTALHRLLTDGCESPLYNPEVHPSELRATLYHVRSRLAAARPERVPS